MMSFTNDQSPIVLDSSVIVAYFRENENLHSLAVDFINSRDEFWVSDYIIAETMTVLQLREGRKAMAGAIKMLTENKNIHLIRLTWEELAETVTLMQTYKKEISFIDCSLLILAQARDLRIATFDKGMIEAGKPLNVLDLHK